MITALSTTFTFIRIGLALVRIAKLMLSLVGPLVVLIAVGVVAYILAPEMSSSVSHASRDDIETFFTTAAVVLATILVTLIVQDALFASRELRPAAVAAMVYIVLGEVAATLGLVLEDAPELRRITFALAMSATLASLAAVLFIAIHRALTQAPELEELSGGSAVILSAPQIGVAQAAASAQIAAPSPPEVARGPTPTEPQVELAPAAIDDLHRLEPINQRLILRTIQQAFAAGTDGADVHYLSGTQWRELRIGNLRVLFQLRPAAAGTNDAHAAPAEVIIARIVRRSDIDSELITNLPSAPEREPEHEPGGREQ